MRMATWSEKVPISRIFWVMPCEVAVVARAFTPKGRKKDCRSTCKTGASLAKSYIILSAMASPRVRYISQHPIPQCEEMTAAAAEHTTVA